MNLLRRSFAGRTALACLSLVTLGAPSCDPHVTALLGPNEYFEKVLDINGDGDLSRAEWQVRFLETNVQSGPFFQYERSDCNQDGRLSWREYFDGILKFRRCDEERQGIYPFLDIDEKFSTQILPILLVQEEINFLESVENQARDMALESHIESFPRNIVEENLESSEMASIVYSCHVSEVRNIKFELTIHYPSASYPSAICEIQNNSKDMAITMLATAVEAEYPSGMHTSWHGKAVYIPPQASDIVTVLFPPNSIPKKVELKLVRGMGSSFKKVDTHWLAAFCYKLRWCSIFQ